MAWKRKKSDTPDDVDAPNEWTADLAVAISTYRPTGMEHADAPPRPSYVGPIVATLLCVPFGLIAIVFALQTPIRWRRGDQAGSRRAAEQAEFWMYASVGAFVLLSFIYGMVWVFYLRNQPRYG